MVDSKFYLKIRKISSKGMVLDTLKWVLAIIIILLLIVIIFIGISYFKNNERKSIYDTIQNLPNQSNPPLNFPSTNGSNPELNVSIIVPPTDVDNSSAADVPAINPSAEDIATSAPSNDLTNSSAAIVPPINPSEGIASNAPSNAASGGGAADVPPMSY